MMDYKIFVSSQNLRIHVFAKNEAKKSSQSSRRLREVGQSTFTHLNSTILKKWRICHIRMLRVIVVNLGS